MSGVRLFDLAVLDADRMAAIERECYTLPWSRAMFVSELAGPMSICIGAVCVDSGRLVGYVIASSQAGTWHVMNVAVDVARRREGIAAQLLDELLARTPGRDDGGYTLEVRASNEAAIALYERYGFRRHGMRPGYYVVNRVDALVMWRPPNALALAGAIPANMRRPLLAVASRRPLRVLVFPPLRALYSLIRRVSGRDKDGR